MVEHLNTIARLWWDWSAAMFWQVGLLILVIAVIDRLIRRWAWPQLRYALWSLILVKLLLPPSLSLPSGVVPGLAPVVRQALVRLESSRPPATETQPLFSLSEDMLSVRSTGILPVSSMGVPPMNLTELHGQDARATHGRDAHATETPYGVTTSEFLGADIGAPSSALHSPSSVVIWQVYAMAASLAGTLILGVWLFLRLHSLVGRNAQIAAAASLPQSFYNQLAGCANRLELRCIPRVVVTKRLATPAVFGVFRPVLLMPKGYLRKLSRRDTEHMLLHELAHIKRGDLVAHGLYMLLQIVYWHNPLLWLVRRQMHHLRELSCDATVAELLREQTTAYRQTLLETARRLLTSSVEPGLGLLGLFEDSNRLLVRLNWLTKPTWRYRTMKRVTVATIAALMLVCVLPMARAQEAASNDQSPEVVRHDEQASQEIATLQAQLEQLMSQQKQLQEQLRVLAEKRSQMGIKDKPKHMNPPAAMQPHVQKTPEKRDVTIVPWQDKEWTDDEVRTLRETRKQAEQAQQEQARAMAEVKKAQQEVERARQDVVRAATERHRAEAEHQKEWSIDQQTRQWTQSEQMKQWQVDVEKWQTGEEMKRWQQEMQKWGEEMGRRVAPGGEAPADGAAISPTPMRAMPPMPPMPAMPPMEGVPGHVPAVPAMPHVSAQPHPVPQANVNVDIPHVQAPVKVAPALPVAPTVPATPKMPEHVVPCGEFVVKSFPAEGTLQVENNVGSLAVTGAEGDNCTVVATARIKGGDREEAERIARRIQVQVTPVAGRVRVRTQFLDDWDQEQRDRIAIDLKVTVPGGAEVQVAQKVGNVNLSSLSGKVAATADVGAIQAWDLQGDVSLRTNVGNIKFATFRDLSAKIQAQANVGSISSNLPLEITGAAMMQAGGAQNALGSHATGTLGQGKNKIDLAANVGSIQIRWEEAPQKHEVF